MDTSNPAGLPSGWLGFSLLCVSLVRMAAGFAEGKSGDHARIAKRRFGSKKPKLPPGKPVGFFGSAIEAVVIREESRRISVY